MGEEFLDDLLEENPEKEGLSCPPRRCHFIINGLLRGTELPEGGIARCNREAQHQVATGPWHSLDKGTFMEWNNWYCDEHYPVWKEAHESLYGKQNESEYHRLGSSVHGKQTSSVPIVNPWET